MEPVLHPSTHTQKSARESQPIRKESNLRGTYLAFTSSFSCLASACHMGRGFAGQVYLQPGREQFVQHVMALMPAEHKIRDKQIDMHSFNKRLLLLAGRLALQSRLHFFLPRLLQPCTPIAALLGSSI